MGVAFPAGGGVGVVAMLVAGHVDLSAIAGRNRAVDEDFRGLLDGVVYQGRIPPDFGQHLVVREDVWMRLLGEVASGGVLPNHLEVHRTSAPQTLYVHRWPVLDLVSNHMRDALRTDGLLVVEDAKWFVGMVVLGKVGAADFADGNWWLRLWSAFLSRHSGLLSLLLAVGLGFLHSAHGASHSAHRASVGHGCGVCGMRLVTRVLNS